MHSNITESAEVHRKQKFPIFKTISFAISGILIISSFVCFWQANKLAEPFHELENAKPIYIPVDISKEAIYTCEIKHSKYAELSELGADLLLMHNSDLTFPEIFKELEGKVEIFNSSGELINEFNLHNEKHEAQTYRLGTENVKGCPPMWVIYPFTPECRELRLTVTKPVKALDGVEQTLEGYYLLCGMEFLASGLIGLLGLILLGLGLLITIIVLFVIWRRRKKARRAIVIPTG